MTELTKPLHVLIVGGSLSGLFAGVALKRLGHKVTIFERSPIPLLHDQGAGVVAGSQTLQWVQKYTGRPIEDISVESQERLYLNKHGDIIDLDRRCQRMTSWSLLYHLGRELFDGQTTNTSDQEHIDGSQSNARYEYGHTVTAVKEVGEQVELHFDIVRENKNEQLSSNGIVQGDFVIVADGPSSKLRSILLGTVSPRKYAGYVAFRGTVPEAELSPEAQQTFVERFCFYHGSNPNTQILAYTIPNSRHSLQKGQRLVNWVWYWNVAEEDEEYKQLMTDIHGKHHRFTLPTGGQMQHHVWQKQKDIASTHLPPQYIELVHKTENPFVQAVTDLEPPEERLHFSRPLNGKAVIIGDALAGFRPHTAASTSQGAFHALLLDSKFRGDISWNEYEAKVYDFARDMQRHGVMLGTRSQFGHHPLSG